MGGKEDRGATLRGKGQGDTRRRQYHVCQSQRNEEGSVEEPISATFPTGQRQLHLLNKRTSGIFCCRGSCETFIKQEEREKQVAQEEQ
jgi:hypothetical protein